MSVRTRINSRSVVFLVSLVVFSILAFRFLSHTVDDAFISFRYAENLAMGFGPVFNPGERVEGYTNFLWVMLIAPFIGLGFDPELVARGLGLTAAGGTLAGTTRLSPRPESFPEVVWIAPLLLASSPAFGLWATGGLETPLFSCLLIWTVALVKEGVERRRLSPVSALCLAGAALTRPEGFGIAIVLGALLFVLNRGRSTGGRELLHWGLTFLTVFVPYFIWRWSYYGDPLPNTFYAKVGSDTSQAFRGLLYVHSYFKETGYWLLSSFVGLIWSTSRLPISIIGGVTVAFTGYVVLVGGDGLPMYRFLVPILPLFFLLTAFGVAGGLTRMNAGRAWGVAVAIALLLAGGRAILPAFRGDSARYVEQDRIEVEAWKRIGLWFAANAPGNASIAVIPAGAMPYYSKLVTIDMLGLNDRTIAHRDMPTLGSGQAGHEKHDVAYVLSRRPTYVMIGVYGLAPEPLPPTRLLRPYYAAEIEMLRSPLFRELYRLHRGQTAGGYFPYFRRADISDEDDKRESNADPH
jgi:hypothetical protein